MFETITLHTMNGQKVVDVTVPKFKRRPEIMVWGSRTFIWDKKADQYREGMAFYVLPIPGVTKNGL